MIQSLKQIKSRIRSVENVKKVTHAMEMISVAKLKPAENLLFGLIPYFSRIEAVLKNLLYDAHNLKHPFVREQSVSNKKALCIITSDTGLCSSYNNDIIRLSQEYIRNQGQEKILLVILGRKALQYFKKQDAEIYQAYVDLHGRYSEELHNKLVRDITDIFLTGKADEVYVAYTNFKSASRHTPVIEKILNIDTFGGKFQCRSIGEENRKPEGLKEGRFAALSINTEHTPDKFKKQTSIGANRVYECVDSQEAKQVEYIVEPDINTVLEELIPVYISTKIKLVLLNAFACEHASRMLAMGEATNNARELLEGLVMSRNKLRQANITKEILEIVSTAEVLN